MKKIICTIFLMSFAIFSVSAADLSCGPGYILTTHAKIDGIAAAECQKLWCRDMETGRDMGSGEKATAGYVATSAPVELCDNKGNCIECFGERKWCSGETRGEWNPEYGGYTRSGADNATYQSYLKGSCFAWQLGKPNCDDNETAILIGDEWVCTTVNAAPVGAYKSSIRRTGTQRRILR